MTNAFADWILYYRIECECYARMRLVAPRPLRVDPIKMIHIKKKQERCSLYYVFIRTMKKEGKKLFEEVVFWTAFVSNDCEHRLGHAYAAYASNCSCGPMASNYRWDFDLWQKNRGTDCARRYSSQPHNALEDTTRIRRDKRRKKKRWNNTRPNVAGPMRCGQA